MNKINLVITTQYKKLDKSLLPQIKHAVQVAFRFAAKEGKYSLSLLFCDDEFIRNLNKTYRGIDRVTDVLSFSSEDQFPDSDEFFLGDIAISYPTAARQAEKYGHPVIQELTLLCIHGTLHLLGYDHATYQEEEKMWGLQKSILNEIGHNLQVKPGDWYAQE